MKILERNRIKTNPYIIFFPFLIIYLLYVISFHADGFWGDEGKYVMYAENLLNLGYAREDLYIGAGPGYPIVLIPFVAFNIPYIWGAILNAVLYYLSVVFLYQIVMNFTNRKLALISGLFMAVYINGFEYMQYLLPEILPSFLMLSFLKLTREAYKNKPYFNKYIIFSGLVLGYLALTKIIFGYVILCIIIFYGIIILFKSNSIPYKKTLIISFIALITCVPYLTYTYAVTNKLFYWGTTGGSNLYWLSNPVMSEYGDWYPYHSLEIDSQRYKTNPVLESSFKENHRTIHKRILPLDAVEQDIIYKEAAINNIKNNPGKFIINWVSNVGRIVFNYPYSYKYQKPGTLIRFPFNGLIVILSLFCLLPVLLNWNKVSDTVKLAFLISLFYLGGSTLGSAETRMFTPIVPMLIIWVMYIFSKTAKIRFKF